MEYSDIEKIPSDEEKGIEDLINGHLENHIKKTFEKKKARNPFLPKEPLDSGAGPTQKEREKSNEPSKFSKKRTLEVINASLRIEKEEFVESERNLNSSSQMDSPDNLKTIIPIRNKTGNIHKRGENYHPSINNGVILKENISTLNSANEVHHKSTFMELASKAM